MGFKDRISICHTLSEDPTFVKVDHVSEGKEIIARPGPHFILCLLKRFPPHFAHPFLDQLPVPLGGAGIFRQQSCQTVFQVRLIIACSLYRIDDILGVDAIGAPGSTAIVAMLNDAVKKGGIFASKTVGGLSGAFIPVMEDAVLAEAVGRGELCLEKLEAMT
jgi:hypothetical protein